MPSEGIAVVAEPWADVDPDARPSPRQVATAAGRALVDLHHAANERYEAARRAEHEAATYGDAAARDDAIREQDAALADRQAVTEAAAELFGYLWREALETNPAAFRQRVAGPPDLDAVRREVSDLRDSTVHLARLVARLMAAVGLKGGA